MDFQSGAEAAAARRLWQYTGGKMFRRITSLLMSVLIVAGTCLLPDASFADQSSPELVAESAVLINAQTGQVLYDKLKDYQEFPASTTKVMTALLTLENKSMDEVVTISHDAAYTEGSRIYLLEGEHVTIEQLLYAMMLESANDAAIALAEAVGGDITTFAGMMNDRAEELGCTNTHFETPNGLPNDNHLTTANDLALITQEAMKNDDFRKIVSTYSYDIQPTDMQTETRHLHNTNKLLSDTSTTYVDGVGRPYKYDGILGVKTGYTNAAQSCLVAAAERDGVQLIGVILKSDPDNQYPDMIKLLDYGFNTFKNVKIITAGEELGTVKIKKGSVRNAGVTVKEDVYASAEAGLDGSTSTKDYSYTLTVREQTAPLEKGTVVGEVTVFNGSREAGTYDLILMEDVDQSSMASILANMDPISSLKMCMTVVFAFLAMYGIFVAKVRRDNRRARERRRALRSERMKKYEEDAAQMDLQRSDNILSEYNVQNSVNDIVERAKAEAQNENNE